MATTSRWNNSFVFVPSDPSSFITDLLIVQGDGNKALVNNINWGTVTASDTLLDSSLTTVAATTVSLGTSITLQENAQAVASVTGTLTTSIRLASSPIAQATASAQLTTAIPLASSPASQATITASLPTTIQFNSSLTGVAAVGSSLSTSITLASSFVVAGSATADLNTNNIPIIAAALAASSIVTVGLVTSIQLESLLSSSASSSASLETLVRLASSSLAVSTAQANILTGILLESLRTAGASSSASLTTAISLDSPLVSQASVAADLSTPTSGVIFSDLSCSGVCIASLSTVIPIASSLEAGGTSMASLSTTVLLSSALTNESSFTTELATAITLQVDCVAVASITSDIVAPSVTTTFASSLITTANAVSTLYPLTPLFLPMPMPSGLNPHTLFPVIAPAATGNTSAVPVSDMENEVTVYLGATATFGGATVTLQASPDSGVTWINVPNASFTSGAVNSMVGKFTAFGNLLRLAFTGGTSATFIFAMKVETVRKPNVSQFTFTANGSSSVFSIPDQACVFQMLNSTSPSPVVPWTVYGTFGSGTMALQSSPDGGTTWYNVTTGVTTNATQHSTGSTDLLFRFTLTGATAPTLTVNVVL